MRAFGESLEKAKNHRDLKKKNTAIQVDDKRE